MMGKVRFLGTGPFFLEMGLRTRRCRVEIAARLPFIGTQKHR